MRHGRPLPRRQPAAAQHCVAGGPDTTVHRLSFVARPEKMVRNGLGREADFSYWQCYEALVSRGYGPIAQLDRVTDFYSVGCRFESCWDRQQFQCDAPFVRADAVYHPVLKKPFNIWLSRLVPLSSCDTNDARRFGF